MSVRKISKKHQESANEKIESLDDSSSAMEAVPVSPIDGVLEGYTDVVRDKRRPRKNSYQTLPPHDNKYLAFVTAIESALDYWIFILRWPKEVEARYRNSGARHDSFRYMLEDDVSELEGSNELEWSEEQQIRYGEQYLCHMANIQFNFHGASKEILTSMRSNIQDCNNFVLVSVGNIDTYNRILIEMYSIKDIDINYNKWLTETNSDNRGIPLATKYRPRKKYLQ